MMNHVCVCAHRYESFRGEVKGEVCTMWKNCLFFPRLLCEVISLFAHLDTDDDCGERNLIEIPYTTLKEL
jgi:hypothetical protein